MQIQITIKDTVPSENLEDLLHKKSEKLLHFSKSITQCKVLIHLVQKHQHQGKLFCVDIRLAVPGKEMIVNKHFDEDIYIAIRDAFHAIERKLETYKEKKHGDIKSHPIVLRGRIKKILLTEGYGFIEGNDGNEYYFGSRNLHRIKFANLHQGDIVRFLATVADEGLQAHRVTRSKSNPL